MNKFGRALLSCAVAALTLAAAPAQGGEPTLSCRGALEPKRVAELLFGRDIGRRFGVGEAAWARFLTRELTPRFPDGLTVSEAIGQWRDPVSGKTVREPTKRVEIVLPGRDDDDARLDAVVQSYKREFHQRSIGVIVRPACASF